VAVTPPTADLIELTLSTVEAREETRRLSGVLTGSDMNDERFHLIVKEPGDKTRHYRGGVEPALLATLRLIPLDSRVRTEIAASVPSPSRWSAPSPSQAPPPAEISDVRVVAQQPPSRACTFTEPTQRYWPRM